GGSSDFLRAHRNRQICDVCTGGCMSTATIEAPLSDPCHVQENYPPTQPLYSGLLKRIQRGVLRLVASGLQSTPPSPSTLKRWRSVTELHQRTEFETHVGVNSPTGHPLAASARAVN
ncbi:unnamed protein product, partial [Ectocarpus sp. 6 AP-2014]